MLGISLPYAQVRRRVASGTIALALGLAMAGCGLWVPNRTVHVQSRAPVDPGQTYLAVQEVAGQQKYQIVVRDDAARAIQVLAHVDSSDIGHQSYIVLKVDDTGGVLLYPAGALVQSGRVHHALNAEVRSLESAVAYRIGSPTYTQVAPPQVLTGTAVQYPSATPAASAGVAFAPAASPSSGNALARVPPAAPVSYARGEPQRNAYALVIGIEKYRDAPAVAGAHADAEAFSRLAETTLGVPASQIHTMLDDHATKSDIEAEVDWFRLNVGKGGRIFFYFSGHGTPGIKPGRDARVETPYIVPYDGNARSIEKTNLPLAQVLDTLKQSAAKEVFAFVDSCFSGNDAGRRPLVPVELKVPASTVVFSAAKGTQNSGPDLSGQHGLFTKYLLSALGEGRAEIDGDRNITFQELTQWVTRHVEKEAKKANRVQEPDVSGVKDGNRAMNDSVIAYGVDAD